MSSGPRLIFPGRDTGPCRLPGEEGGSSCPLSPRTKAELPRLVRYGSFARRGARPSAPAAGSLAALSPSWAADRLLAAGLLVWAVPDVPWWWRPPGHAAATPVVLGYVALMLAQSVPFLWWRRVPLLVAGLAAAVLAIRTGLDQNLFSASAATAAGAFGLGAWGGPRTRLAARILTAAAVVAAAIVLLTSHGFREEALPFALLAIALGLGEVTAANRDAATASARLAHDAERSVSPASFTTSSRTSSVPSPSRRARPGWPARRIQP